MRFSAPGSPATRPDAFAFASTTSSLKVLTPPAVNLSGKIQIVLAGFAATCLTPPVYSLSQTNAVNCAFWRARKG